jgi:hypothetical protein
MNDALGLALYVAIALLGLISTVAASVWLWRVLLRNQVGVLRATVIVGLAAVLILWGLWIVFDIGWIVATAGNRVARLGSSRRPAAEGG